MEKKEVKDICIRNKEINHKYEIIEMIECGIELKGTEVKSIRKGKATLKDSFALIKNGEVNVKNMHISHYEMGNINNVEEKRDRKLLLHKSEIFKLSGFIKQGGYSLVPRKLYQSGKWFKLQLCVCKGRKLHDNRDKILQSEAKRQINYFKRQKAN